MDGDDDYDDDDDDPSVKYIQPKYSHEQVEHVVLQKHGQIFTLSTKNSTKNAY